MWPSKQWIGRAFGPAVLVMVSVPLVGLTGPLVIPLPEIVEVIKDQEPLAGVSGQSAERQAPMVIGQHVFIHRSARFSPEWLDAHGGRSRAVNREPDLWRHEF